MTRSRSSMRIGEGDRLWHGDILFQCIVEVEAATLSFARLLLNSFHDVHAFSFATREHSASDDARKVRKDRLQAPYHRFEQADAFAQSPVDVGLYGILIVQINDSDNRILLPESVDTPDALFPLAWGSTACRS